MESNKLADYFNFTSLTVLGLAIMLGFLLGGFYGILLVSLGLFGAPIMLIAINVSATLINSGNNFNKLKQRR